MVGVGYKNMLNLVHLQALCLSSSLQPLSVVVSLVPFVVSLHGSMFESFLDSQIGQLFLVFSFPHSAQVDVLPILQCVDYLILFAFGQMIYFVFFQLTSDMLLQRPRISSIIYGFRPIPGVRHLSHHTT